MSAVKQIVILISLIIIDAEQSHPGNSRMLPTGDALVQQAEAQDDPK